MNTNNNANMNDMLKNFSEMMNGKQIPDNIKDVLQNMIQNNNKSSNPENSINVGNTSNSSNQTGTNNINTNNSNSTNNFNNIDINTIFKIQNIMNSLNNDKQNESRANLLLSLKPYLKESRRSKVDQYIQLMKMEKVFQAINPFENNTGGETKNV